VRAVSTTELTGFLDLLTDGPPNGAYDVIVTNPDGQTATLSAAFNVTVAAGVQPTTVNGVASLTNLANNAYVLFSNRVWVKWDGNNASEAGRLVASETPLSLVWGSTNDWTNSSIRNYLNGAYLTGLASSASVLNTTWNISDDQVSAGPYTYSTDKVGLLMGNVFQNEVANYYTYLGSALPASDTWTITRDTNTNVVTKLAAGSVGIDLPTATHDAFPVIHISSASTILGGDGSANNPYIVGP